MKSAITTLQSRLHYLKIELKMWGKAPNNNPKVRDIVKKEIEEHKQALETLTPIQDKK